MKLTCKRSELADWEDVFRQCGAVGRAEAEDRNNFQKFKYAVGRNWDKVNSFILKEQANIKEMLTPSDGYNSFMREVELLNREYCEKDKDGNPVTKEMENGSQAFVFSEEYRMARDGFLDAIKKRYALEIADQEQRENESARYMEGLVDIELFTVPWEYMPERISGAYLARCAVMCTDVPDDVKEMMACKDNA